MVRAFYRILLAFDDSAASRMALQYACAFARTGADLAVANACEGNNLVARAATAGFFPAHLAPLIVAADEECDTVLRAAVTACAAGGIVVDKIFVHGSTVHGIVAAGRKRHADLIVVGTHGRTGPGFTVLGRVAEGLLRVSDVPVLVVTRHAKLPPRERFFERALVAVGDSAPSKSALSIAANLSSAWGTRLSLCTVIDRVEGSNSAARSFEADPRAAGSLLLQRAKATKGIAPFLDDEIVVGGEPADAIEQTAMQRNCDFVIVGSHSGHGLERVLEGSVAETLAGSSAVPVLVIPTPEHAHRISARTDLAHEKSGAGAHAAAPYDANNHFG